MRIFISAGEPSGDLHAANLIRATRALDPKVDFVGYGGPKMAEAGCLIQADLTALAVMWLARALLNLHKFLALLRRADRYFRRERPDAVVLVDFPGFHWWLARRAKAYGIPVYYYAPPQVWAWASWRVKKMRRFVDHVLCALPFEETWYRERGCNATFVGHPYFDEIRRQELDPVFVAEQTRKAGRLVTILPGSRSQEVTSNLRWFLAAARRIKERVPEARFAIAAFKEKHAEFARELIAESGLAIETHVGRTPELIALAECCMAVSGSVSLELLSRAKPTVVLYWVSRFAYFVQGLFRRVKYITLVNLLSSDELFPRDLSPYDPAAPGAEKVLFPEYLTCQDRTESIAKHVIEWLTDDQARGRRVTELEALKKRVAHGGASAQAAQILLSERREKTNGPGRPRFLDARVVRRV